jgi:hypothetical protein
MPPVNDRSVRTSVLRKAFSGRQLTASMQFDLGINRQIFTTSTMSLRAPRRGLPWKQWYHPTIWVYFWTCAKTGVWQRAPIYRTAPWR